MHYYKRNIGDYAKKAGRLSLLEHGVYTLLIDACYDRERFPTLEEAIDWTWARSDEEVAAVKFVLARFFDLQDGVYVQKRIAEEVANYQQNAEKNKRIAIEREQKRTNRTRSVHEASPEQHEAPPNQEPLTKNQEPLTKGKPARKRATKTPLPENFKVSDRVAEWAKQHGHTRLDEHLEVFKRKCIANGYTYASWDDAFMEAVRGDWAKLNQPVRPGFTNPADVARVTVPSKPDRDPVLVKLEQEALKAVGPTPEQRARMEELRRQARVSPNTQPHKTP